MIENETVVLPLVTLTTTGTVTAPSIVSRAIAAPSAGAGPLIVSVPVTVVPPTTLDDESLNDESCNGVTWTFAVLLVPSIEAENVATVPIGAEESAVTTTWTDLAPVGTVTVAGSVM